MYADAAIVPKFLSAKTPKGLSSSMLKNNLLNGIQYRYFDIQFAEGKWYAWYIELEAKDV